MEIAPMPFRTSLRSPRAFVSWLKQASWLARKKRMTVGAKADTSGRLSLRKQRHKKFSGATYAGNMALRSFFL
jgi:hypothetical protein